MADKKSRLLERATTTVRQPRPPSLLEASTSRRSYRVVTVSLYIPEIQWVDHLTRVLQRAGNPKANRSLVIREAITRLREDLQDKSPAEALQSFIEHHVKRMELLENSEGL
jgi:hypothetical protein